MYIKPRNRSMLLALQKHYVKCSNAKNITTPHFFFFFSFYIQVNILFCLFWPPILSAAEAIRATESREMTEAKITEKSKFC